MTYLLKFKTEGYGNTMRKILLAGNGINIKFNPDFSFNNFIEILIDNDKLKNFIQSVLKNENYSEWKKFVPTFLDFVKWSKEPIQNLTEEAKANGVETAIWDFQEEFATIMKQVGIKSIKEDYDKFFIFFKILFFNYLLKVQTESLNILNQDQDWKYFEERIDYQFVYTLNYDNLLELIYPAQKIKYVHGQILFNNNKLSFENCKLEQYNDPKSNTSKFSKLPIFLEKGLQATFDLDILGLNPVNDENILLFFILSGVCKKITFYYHTENDLINFNKFIKTLSMNKYWLENNGDYLELEKIINDEYATYYLQINLVYDEKIQEYTLKVIEIDRRRASNKTFLLKIKLEPSNKFWDFYTKSSVQKMQTVIKKIIVETQK